jgi:hypothetical protein
MYKYDPDHNYSMDREKFPNYFLIAAIFYVIIFLAGFSYFFVPAISFGFGYFEFYLMGLLLFLPLVMLVIYANISRFQFLWGAEKAFRVIITAVTIVDSFMVLYFLFLLV